MAQSMKSLLCRHGDLPDFVPLYPHKKVGMIVCFCNPSTREMEAGGSLRLAGRLPSGTSELQVLVRDLPSRKQDGADSKWLSGKGTCC